VGRPLFLRECLEAILKNELLPEEIIVVDQGSDDTTEQMISQLRSSCPRLVYLRDRIAGASRAKNLAIQQSQGELLAFTDDDCLVAREWLLRAAEEFDRNRDLVCLVGKVLKGVPSTRASQGGDACWEVRGKADPWEIGPSGGNFFLRKGFLKVVGLFDETLGPGSTFRGAEDADMLYRILKAGGLVQYNPKVRIIHRVWRNEQEDLERRYGYGIGVGAFLAKHLSPGDLFPLYLWGKRFSKKPLKFLLGLLLVRKEMRMDGYVWTRGMIRGFCQRRWSFRE